LPTFATETFRTVDDGVRRSGPSRLEKGVRYLDLVVLILALPVFVIADLPLLGWAGAAVGWGGQRAIQAVLESRAAMTDDPKGFFRLMAGSLIGRSWFLVISIFAVGLIDRPAGLAAAVLSLIVFTLYLAISVALRPTKHGEQEG
jgi:hypothetical protein